MLTNFSTLLTNDSLSSTNWSSSPTSTPGRGAKTTDESVPPRIYLQKGNLKDGYLAVNNENYKTYPNPNPNRIQTSVQIYIIFFIGIMPAAIGAFAWWIKNLKNNCLRPSGKRTNTNPDVEKLSHSLMKGDKVPIDNLVHQIAMRAEKMSTGQLIKSRRVYSLEVPRKCLEMIEILGEGNFGQVYKLSFITHNQTQIIILIGLESPIIPNWRQK